MHVPFTPFKICMESEEDAQRTASQNRKPYTTLDMEGVLSENLRSLKNTHRGHLANVTANVNGIHQLLSDDRNLQELTAAEEVFLKFKDADPVPRCRQSQGSVMISLRNYYFQPAVVALVPGRSVCI